MAARTAGTDRNEEITQLSPYVFGSIFHLSAFLLMLEAQALRLPVMFTPARDAKYCDHRVCLSVCPLAFLKSRMSKLYEICCTC